MGKDTSTSQDETLSDVAPQTETVTTPETTDETLEVTTEKQPSIEELLAQNKRIDAALKKANEQAKSHRLKNTEYETQLKELRSFKEQIESERLSVQEREEAARKKAEAERTALLDENASLKKQIQEQTDRYEFNYHATKLNMVDPTDAIYLIPKDRIERDENGKPTNIPDLLKELIKTKPYLASKPVSTSGGATNPPRSQSGTQPLSWEVIGKLTPADYEMRRKEIQQWMDDPKNMRV